MKYQFCFCFCLFFSLNKPDKSALPGLNDVSLGNEPMPPQLTLRDRNAQHRLINREDSDFSLPSGLSVKSEQSMDQPIRIRGGPVTTELNLNRPNKPSPPGPSHVSLGNMSITSPSSFMPEHKLVEREQSMDYPHKFSRGSVLIELNLNKPDKSPLPGLNDVSLGNEPMPPQLTLRDRNAQHRLINREDSDFSLPSGLSVKSEQSMDQPIRIRGGPVTTELKYVSTVLSTSLFLLT
ncbi:uncharacterized protein LOC127946915 [Carassius gibelio]|uniref:uncharacterized protein LOC127946915 n=1 Tax=Carassius gibelio TaxID=101364 RepID=UPI002278D434|nr:uncharacterized protein LOC127946915 [Carassius gibelio]